jgi:hypothetical protein
MPFKTTLINDAFWLAVGLPVPEREYKFHHTRKWRFDFAFVEKKLAVEIEGGIYISGRHTRCTGFMKDLEKYNAAALLGWRLLRYTPQHVNFYEIRDLYNAK